MHVVLKPSYLYIYIFFKYFVIQSAPDLISYERYSVIDSHVVQGIHIMDGLLIVGPAAIVIDIQYIYCHFWH